MPKRHQTTLGVRKRFQIYEKKKGKNKYQVHSREMDTMKRKPDVWVMKGVLFAVTMIDK